MQVSSQVTMSDLYKQCDLLILQKSYNDDDDDDTKIQRELKVWNNGTITK